MANILQMQLFNAFLYFIEVFLRVQLTITQDLSIGSGSGFEMT